MNKGCLFALGALLVISSIGLGIYFYKQSNKDPIVYETAKPEITDIVKKTVATGAVRPRQEVNIKPQVSGVIDELFIEAGEMVKKGQQIARIKLIPSEVNINNAQSNVELARLRYDDAKRELERQRKVFSQKLDMEDARVRLENAKREEERNRQLFEEGVVSEQDYNQFKRDYELAQAAFDNAEILSANNIRQFENNVDIRHQELQAAISNLQLLREGVASNSKQVANIVTSTVDGMVLDVPVEEGSSVIERNNFNEGTTIASIADMNSLVFEGKVDESDVGKLKEGMPLELTVGAIEGKTFEATLEYIAPKGEEEEGTVKFEVKAAIKPAEDVFLRAGYSANADIILDRRQQVLAIKERDLLFEQDSTFVEVQVGDQEFQRRAVQVGLSDGVQIEVLNGIDSTTQVKVQKNL
ncbi:MAG: HlyD family efflux transporter periplasmic adaptor subunit [Saprospiraceae bacterium]|nr:HlyD family efflux transporter periplasmic adaptor subunit [Saprospiraceae bacterium]MCB0678665.1 HlyD family efflux transporter periplasmic adaptor subunit [Saprospiraceae bacterium]MCB0681546.1 HlyD family efflux transporter periplasmic adaptor subunit [Saprospiraceae bacterium]